uniref:UspA domain-containing protein n=1 Tax=Lotharella globosa TaxID=91324 RepID=A0A7S3YNJ7_9EUKA|mmetsp:Transcript_28868/g.56097  ORF Transcript_28868/g.56097 Transcript_28868/m.56097 type:complete len:182 (+) Transcript_28868:102-647(+)|eukprot:CAMPEP_0167777346 /NCGR_PEP_ID=MMETSP0111_2-20121227/3642_1 /TAXON_ID=91324 /ORGANISM="Lotharella globosa, Strain CCCM811" /LENGTH=181 /DNA_ID=CAMNT_0007667519 /DNA_START=56 /DNA_END=601 /DNA_ORIENTATION=+
MAESSKQEMNLLVALDGSDMSEHVIDWCAKRFTGKTDKIHMVHVVEYSLVTVLPSTDLGLAYDDLEEGSIAEKVKQGAHKKGVKYLEKCKDRFESKGVKSVDAKVLLAHPSKSVKTLLCEYADKLKPDVIVCGSRGMGYMGRTFLGSVSDYLMHNVKCSVMVVKEVDVPKPPAEEKTSESK